VAGRDAPLDRDVGEQGAAALPLISHFSWAILAEMAEFFIKLLRLLVGVQSAPLPGLEATLGPAFTPSATRGLLAFVPLQRIEQGGLTGCPGDIQIKSYAEGHALAPGRARPET
jgi:hypothetical protein